MRALRTTLAAAWLLGVTPALALAQAKTTPADLLAFQPTQPGVEYDIPTEAAAIAACKVETVYDAQKNSIGYALRDGQGKLLRKFVNLRPDKLNRLDQWSYYQDGFEVYRDVDLDNDKYVDECRWLNMAGTRQAVVSKNKITAWKQLSAEEASKVLVQALVAGDLGLLETVMATPDELASLGVPKGEVEQVSAAAAKRGAQVNELRKDLKGWEKSTVWQRFDGTMPHVIPVDAGTSLKKDLTLYENAVVFAGQPNGQGNSANMAFLQASELVKIGEVWKFVELPRAVNPQNPVAVMAQDGGIRASLFREAVSAGPANAQLATALQELAAFDNQNANVLGSGDKKATAQFYLDRIKLLNAVVKQTTGEEDKLIYNKQIVDSVSAAYQTGLYPRGLEVLDYFVKDGGKIASYAAFRKLNAENALKGDQPDANLIALQKELLTKLEEFYNKFPSCDEASEALYQLASLNEFSAEEEQARKFYKLLADGFPNTDFGKKAAGALRRFELAGTPIALKGAGLNGEVVDATKAAGKTLLVYFWGTWADPSVRDLPELIKLSQKFRGKGFEIVAVNLDPNKEVLDKFLKDNPLPWPQIYESGGMDSRLATEYGIISLPTMFLVDAEGKVVSRSIRTPIELEKQLEKLGLDKPVGAALKPR